MNRNPSQNDVVNDYIDQLDEKVAPLFLDIRATVLNVHPDFNESIKWKDCLVYSQKKNHIQTVVGKGKISLIFFFGVQIEDEFGLLEGDGKKTRTMRITSPEYNKAALTSYVQQSLSLE